MKTMKIELTEPMELAILNNALANYEAEYNEHLKTSKDNGFITDALIKQTIDSLKAKLNTQENK